jgi:xanthine dehydrogenase/oxidase
MKNSYFRHSEYQLLYRFQVLFQFFIDSFPIISITENIIEHVAKSLDMDSILVRRINFYKKDDVTPYGQPLPYFNVNTIMGELIVQSDYEKRATQVTQFNKDNRWKKKGISLVPVKWGLANGNVHVVATVAILSYDGSVLITHGGVEMGIN